MIQKNIHSKQMEKSIQSASDARATSGMETYGKRRICHDSANRHALASLELLEAHRPTDVSANNRIIASDGRGAGLARIILDVLDADPMKSVLFLGETIQLYHIISLVLVTLGVIIVGRSKLS